MTEEQQQQPSKNNTLAILLNGKADLPQLDGISRLPLHPITSGAHDDDTHELLAKLAERESPVILVPVDEEVLTKTVSILRTGNYKYAVANIDENITTPVWLDLMKQSTVVDLAEIVADFVEQEKDQRRVEQAGSETAQEVKEQEIDELKFEE
jgi:hypothetical protein